MPATRTRHPAVSDLASLGQVPPQLIDVLVVDFSYLVLAKEARLSLEHLRLSGTSASRTRSALTIFPRSRLRGHAPSLQRSRSLMAASDRESPPPGSRLHLRRAAGLKVSLGARLRNIHGVSQVESGRPLEGGRARVRCALAGSAGAAVWALQEPLDQWALRSHYSDVAVLGKVVIGGRAWWPAGLALHLVNGAVFGLVYYEARRRWPQRPRLLAMSMALGEHAALYPLGYFVDRFHPRRGTRGVPPLMSNRRAFAQATWRHSIFGVVLGHLA